MRVAADEMTALKALAPQIALMATSVGETALAKANARAALAEAL